MKLRSSHDCRHGSRREGDRAREGTSVPRPVVALTAWLRERLVAGHYPLFVGIDGRSGVGKSTLAAALSKDLVEAGDGAGDVTVIDGDDFYAGGSAEVWDRQTAAEKADRVIDWRRQRDVLQRLREGGVAEWHPSIGTQRTGTATSSRSHLRRLSLG